MQSILLLPCSNIAEWCKEKLSYHTHCNHFSRDISLNECKDVEVKWKLQFYCSFCAKEDQDQTRIMNEIKCECKKLYRFWSGSIIEDFSERLSCLHDLKKQCDIIDLSFKRRHIIISASQILRQQEQIDLINNDYHLCIYDNLVSSMIMIIILHSLILKLFLLLQLKQKTNE